MLVKRNRMKNAVPYLFVILMAAGITYFVFAAEQTNAMAAKQDESKEMMHKGKMHEGMMHREMMHKEWREMCPMHTMMSDHMMKMEMVAMPDGDVVVLAAGKLYKYDKDFNLVKEVELKAVQDSKTMMEQMQKECMEKCQMMKPEKPAGEKK
jgi:hypothetical protein